MLPLPQPHILDIIMVYALLFLAFYGWGTIASHILKLDLRAIPGAFFSSVWLGWAAMIFMLQAVHIFLPLNGWVSLSLYLTGLTFGLYTLIRQIPSIQSTLRPQDSKQRAKLALFFLLAVMAACWAASRGLLPISNYDSGLYHFSMMRWINSYPLVPGLGNLHGRLAYNQSFFTYAASLNFSFYPYARSIANSFLVVLTITELVWGIVMQTQTANRQNVNHFARLFGILSVYYISIVSDGMSAPSPDLASSLVQFTLFFWFIDILQQLRHQQFPREQLYIVFILSVTLVTLKLSNLIFVLCLLLFCLAYAWRLVPDKRIFLMQNIRLPILLLGIASIWLIRGITASGYPFYPLTIGRLPVDWTIPAEKAQREADNIYSWARMQGRDPSEVLGNNAWIRPWLSRTYQKYRIEVVYPLFLSLGLGSVAFLAALLGKKLKGFLADLAFIIPIVIGMIYWFLMAPDPRFAHALFFLLPIGVILILLGRIEELSGARTVKWTAWALSITLASYLISIQFDNIGINFAQTYATIPVAELVEQRTDSGLLLYVPANNGNQCWDMDLLCTVKFDRGLRLRDPEGLRAGFAIDSESK